MRPADRLLPSRRDRHQVVRALASLAASLAVVNAFFWFWPDVAHLPPDAPPYLVPLPAEQIVLEPVVPTRQTAPAFVPLPPSPPPPDLVPDEVPDDVILREVAPRLPAPPVALDERPVPARPVPAPSGRVVPAAPPAPPAPPALPGDVPRTPSSARLVERPTRSPRQTRLPLPVYPEAARRDGLQARVRVRVLVSETGTVLAAEIIERFVLDRSEQPQPVASLPFGLDAEALATARRARFLPALDGEERVRAYAIVTLAFDPPAGD